MFTGKYTPLPLINQYLADRDDSEISQLIDIIGRGRLTSYVKNTTNNRDALALYQVNAQLSKHIHELIGGFEVALRNRISTSLINYYGRDDWYRCRELQKHLSIERRQNIGDVRKHLRGTNKAVNIGRVVSGLTFHFWVSMHENKYRDSIWTPHLHKIWPKSEKLKTVHKDLLKTRDLRNRIAHHEPIFLNQWRWRTNIIWDRFAQVSPEKSAWFRERLDDNINLLNSLCEELCP